MDSRSRSRLTIILNSESGTIVEIGLQKVEQSLIEIFNDLGCAHEIQKVQGKDVPAALEAAREGESDAVLVGGGDGTVASAAAIFAGHQKPLGILPLGTFNLAARDVGMPLDWQEAAKLLVTAPIAEIDLLDINGKLCLCLVVLGFYPALVMGRVEYHGNWIVKSARTLWEAMRSAATFPPLALQLNDRERVTRSHTRMALIANNDYEEIFGVIPKRRSLDAGYFTAYILKHATRFGLLKSCLTWVMGRWKKDREIETIQATQLQIDVKRKRSIPVMMDGEVEKIALPLIIKIVPKALRVIAPRLDESPAKNT